MARVSAPMEALTSFETELCNVTVKDLVTLGRIAPNLTNSKHPVVVTGMKYVYIWYICLLMGMFS